MKWTLTVAVEDHSSPLSLAIIRGGGRRGRTRSPAGRRATVLERLAGGAAAAALPPDTCGTLMPLALGPAAARRPRNQQTVLFRAEPSTEVLRAGRAAKSSGRVLLIHPKWRFDATQNGNFNQNEAAEGRNADKKKERRR